MNRRGFLGFLAALGFGGKAAAEAVVGGDGEPKRKRLNLVSPEGSEFERDDLGIYGGEVIRWDDERPSSDDTVNVPFKPAGQQRVWARWEDVDAPKPPWERRQLILVQSVAAEDIEPLDHVSMTDAGELIPHRPWDGFPPAIGYSERGGKAGDLVDFFLAVPDHFFDNMTETYWLGPYLPSTKKP